jgi:hypothetical protein
MLGLLVTAARKCRSGGYDEQESSILPRVLHRGLGGGLPPFFLNSVKLTFGARPLNRPRSYTVIRDAGTPCFLPAIEYVPLPAIPWRLPRQDVRQSPATQN